ncbi:MAG: shikimate kinase [Deltaproteobacteria bacterium]|nr:shikimate kinase [Deltaproteobacteria bacterium]
MNNITLIGMPGSGKSTTGVILAKLLSFEFIDTDILIQLNLKRSLQDIVDKEGHIFLRRVEEDEILKISPDRCVISTGGSAVYSKKAMAHLSSFSVICFLRADFSVIEKRIVNFDQRGIAKAGDQSFYDLFMERQPLYEKYADIEIDCNSLSQEEAAGVIAERIMGLPGLKKPA